jgi:hypothetical protein
MHSGTQSCVSSSSASPAGGAARSKRIAVARRLLTLAYHALRSENGCRSYPVNPATMVEARSLAVMPSADGS